MVSFYFSRENCAFFFFVLEDMWCFTTVIARVSVCCKLCCAAKVSLVKETAAAHWCYFCVKLIFLNEQKLSNTFNRRKINKWPLWAIFIVRWWKTGGQLWFWLPAFLSVSKISLERLKRLFWNFQKVIIGSTSTPLGVNLA